MYSHVTHINNHVLFLMRQLLIDMSPVLAIIVTRVNGWSKDITQVCRICLTGIRRQLGEAYRVDVTHDDTRKLHTIGVTDIDIDSNRVA